MWLLWLRFFLLLFSLLLLLTCGRPLSFGNWLTYLPSKLLWLHLIWAPIELRRRFNWFSINESLKWLILLRIYSILMANFNYFVSKHWVDMQTTHFCALRVLVVRWYQISVENCINSITSYQTNVGHIFEPFECAHFISYHFAKNKSILWYAQAHSPRTSEWHFYCSNS